jgi:hypothetical protein
MSTQNKYTIYLRFSGGTYKSWDFNKYLYWNSSFKYSQGQAVLDIVEPNSSGWANAKKSIVNYFKRKFETLNFDITEDYNKYSAAPASKRMLIIFSLASESTSSSMYNFREGLRRAVSPTIPNFNFAGTFFKSKNLGFIFLNPDPFVGEFGEAKTAVKIASNILGIAQDNPANTGSGRTAWGALTRKNPSNQNRFLEQWYKGTQDDFKVLATKADYIKPAPPANIANKSEYSSSLVLTKHRLITKKDLVLLNSEEVHSGMNPDFNISTDKVIKGMIGYTGDVDYFKILLDAGNYTLMHVHLKDSMVDLEIELMDEMSEVPKNKNKLNLSSIKSECTNKITKYPNEALNLVECFGLDKNLVKMHTEGSPVSTDSYLSSPAQRPAAVRFNLSKRTFVYFCVRGGGQSPAYSDYSSVGKFAVALKVNSATTKPFADDFSYPSCYLHWTYNPDKITFPERKLFRILTKQNDIVKAVPFYLQEKEDTSTATYLKVRKFNTVINGKLLSESDENGLKFIVDATEYSPLAPSYQEAKIKRFFLTATSRVVPGETRMVEFIAASEGIELTDGDEQYFNTKFISNISDPIYQTGQMPQQPTPAPPTTTTPPPTQTPTPTQTTTPTPTPTPSQTTTSRCSEYNLSGVELDCGPVANPCWQEAKYYSAIGEVCYRCIKYCNNDYSNTYSCDFNCPSP